MARAVIRLGGLRSRLLVAFVLVAVPPLVVLAVAASALVRRTSEAAARQRLEAALGAARAEVGRRQAEARDKVQRIVDQDLPELAAGPEEDDRGIAENLADRRDLDALEILDGQGRVVSSRHWPAGFALPDRDETFPGADDMRLEKVAEGYGASTRLTITASQAAQWRGAPVTVRGGTFVDGEFLARLGELAGVEIALRDEIRGQWIAPLGSAVGDWREPAFGRATAYETALAPAAGPSGEVSLRGAGYRWSASALRPSLALVVAVPTTSFESLTARVRHLGLALSLAVLVLALAAALVLSSRIARPVARLANGARRVAAGDLATEVLVPNHDEIGDLAQAFGAMTTELRTSRERLLQAERVAAWREMARRLAHELKNPIFPIQLSIETLRRVCDQEEDGTLPGNDGRFRSLFLESSETILAELHSLRKIIDEFSQFARMPQPHVGPTDVNAVVERTLDLYRARAERIVLEVHLAPGMTPIAADGDLLGRALGNLVGNALDAMPEGGTLRIRTAAAGGSVTIDVEDTGPGLSEEQKTRLFTPYYTTKRGGTGLGLAIVQGIVSDHGGRVEVRSEPGVGTVFTLVLPANLPLSGSAAD